MTEEERERLIAFKDWLNREDYGDVEQLERCWNQAATRMRDACVKKVRAMRDEWFEELRGMLPIEVIESVETHYVTAADEIADELESLTLVQTQQENQP